MKIRYLLPGLVGLLALAMLIETAIKAVDAWHVRDHAYRFALSDQIRGKLIQATGFWAHERGRIFVALARPATPQILAEIGHNRQAGDQLLEEALRLLDHHDALFRMTGDELDQMREARERLAVLRREIDAALAGPASAPTDTQVTDIQVLGERWYTAATEQIEMAQILGQSVLHATPLADEHVAIQTALKKFIWISSELAGRERAQIGFLIASGQPVEPRLELLASLHGQLVLAWQTAHTLAERDIRMDGSPPEWDTSATGMRMALREAEERYDHYIRLIWPRVFQTTTTGERYGGLTAEEWFDEMTTVIDALYRVRDASIAHMADHTATLAENAAHSFVIALTLLILGLAASLAALVIIDRRILTPIRSLTEAMVRLSEDNLSVTVPDVGRVDEIGAMTASVEVFKRTAVMRRRLSAFQNAILSSANNSVIATDTSGVIQLFNATAERMLGYQAHEVIGLHTPLILHLDEEVTYRARQLSEETRSEIAPGFEAIVARARKGIPDLSEWTYVRKDGTRFPVLLSVTAIRDEDEELLGFLGVGTDITQLKEVERLKSEFISTVSHELRTPLTAIRASLGMVASGAFGTLPAEAQQLSDIALQSSERLVRLINDLLDVEKIASGALKLDVKPLDLRSILERAIADNQPHAERLGVATRLTAAAGPQVLADSDRLIQVFTNLLSNAAKFSPPGDQVEINITQPHKGWVRISVTDHGPGIPEAFRARVFDKFAQADSSDQRTKGGTGLGLNITKSIVERLQGRIWFSTAVGQGTTFHVELPVWQSEQPPAIGPRPPNPDGSRPRILICEDDADVSMLLAMLLEQAGFDTARAGTAAEAKAMLKEWRNKAGDTASAPPFAAMTLDLRLPDQNGVDLIRDLRAQPSTRELPIIIVSAEADVGRAKLEGDVVAIIDWLNKPIDQERLIAGVHSAVRNGKSRRRRILHIEDDTEIAAVVRALLSSFADVVSVGSLQAARTAMANERFDLAIIDLGLPDGYGLDLLPDLKDELGRSFPVVVFTARETSPVDLERVAATLVKSRVSNEVLVETIRALIPGEAMACQP